MPRPQTGPYKSWTKEDEDLLRDLYPTTSFQDLAKIFDCTIKAIHHRREKLGIPAKKAIVYWTPDRIAYLSENYGLVPLKEMAVVLGRSTISIRAMASKLGVRRRPVRYEALADGDWLPALTEAERGYLAGLIDGEGTISIHKVHPRDMKGRARNFRYQPCVLIANTNENLINWIVQKLGATVWFYQRHRPYPGRPCWSVGWMGYRSLPLIRLVRDLLIVKAEQADIVLEYGRLRLEELNYNSKYGPEYEPLLQRIQNLNRRGLPLLEKAPDDAILSMT